ncbi:hypothetical protein FHT00_000630 [Sphingomonas insulae]|nr:hypothetical protein [Sphingomonas insulae]NIJ28702.1 hypothetical protein [Sphingomonas insulae]
MSILLMAFLIGIQAQAPSPAAAAADRFALDLPRDDAATVQPEPDTRPVTPSVTPSASPTVANGGFSLDTPIADLIANAQAKAILDRDLPGLSDDTNLPKFQTLSLRKLAPLSGGQMTAALLNKVGTDLAAIDASAPAPGKVEVRRALPSGR